MVHQGDSLAPQPDSGGSLQWGMSQDFLYGSSSRQQSDPTGNELSGWYIEAQEEALLEGASGTDCGESNVGGPGPSATDTSWGHTSSLDGTPGGSTGDGRENFSSSTYSRFGGEWDLVTGSEDACYETGGGLEDSGRLNSNSSTFDGLAITSNPRNEGSVQSFERWGFNASKPPDHFMLPPPPDQSRLTQLPSLPSTPAASSVDYPFTCSSRPPMMLERETYSRLPSGSADSIQSTYSTFLTAHVRRPAVPPPYFLPRNGSARLAVPEVAASYASSAPPSLMTSYRTRAEDALHGDMRTPARIPSREDSSAVSDARRELVPFYVRPQRLKPPPSSEGARVESCESLSLRPKMEGGSAASTSQHRLAPPPRNNPPSPSLSPPTTPPSLSLSPSALSASQCGNPWNQAPLMSSVSGTESSCRQHSVPSSAAIGSAITPPAPTPPDFSSNNFTCFSSLRNPRSCLSTDPSKKRDCCKREDDPWFSREVPSPASSPTGTVSPKLDPGQMGNSAAAIGGVSRAVSIPLTQQQSSGNDRDNTTNPPTAPSVLHSTSDNLQPNQSAGVSDTTNPIHQGPDLSDFLAAQAGMISPGVISANGQEAKCLVQPGQSRHGLFCPVAPGFSRQQGASEIGVGGSDDAAAGRDSSLPFGTEIGALDPEYRKLLKNIPRKSRESFSSSDEAAFRTCNPHFSKNCYILMHGGYDIRLGEAGRATLKREISRRLKNDPKLRDKCVSVVCRLKNANVLQLLQMAEIAGCLALGLRISSSYWKEYTRKQRPSWNSTTSVCGDASILSPCSASGAYTSGCQAMQGSSISTVMAPLTGLPPSSPDSPSRLPLVRHFFTQPDASQKELPEMAAVVQQLLQQQRQRSPRSRGDQEPMWASPIPAAQKTAGSNLTASTTATMESNHFLVTNSALSPALVSSAPDCFLKTTAFLSAGTHSFRQSAGQGLYLESGEFGRHKRSRSDDTEAAATTAAAIESRGVAPATKLQAVSRLYEGNSPSGDSSSCDQLNDPRCSRPSPCLKSSLGYQFPKEEGPGVGDAPSLKVELPSLSMWSTAPADNQLCTQQISYRGCQ